MKKILLFLILLSNASFAEPIYPPELLRCTQNSNLSSCYFLPSNLMNFKIVGYSADFQAGDYAIRSVYFYGPQISLQIAGGSPMQSFQANLMFSNYFPDKDNPYDGWMAWPQNQYECTLYPRSMYCGFIIKP